MVMGQILENLTIVATVVDVVIKTMVDTKKLH